MRLTLRLLHLRRIRIGGLACSRRLAGGVTGGRFGSIATRRRPRKPRRRPTAKNRTSRIRRPTTPATKPKTKSNGAKKDEDTAAKPAQKPASETPAEKPKPKYPPYAELLKDTQKLEGLDHAASQRRDAVRRDRSAAARSRLHRADHDRPRHRPDADRRRLQLGLWRRRGVAVPQGGREHSARAPQRALHGRQGQPDRAGREAGLHRQRAVQPADSHRRARRARTSST